MRNILQKASLTIVTWGEVRDKVHKVNPVLATHIDNTSPSDKLELYKVCYPFGADILKSGELQLPNAAGNLVSKFDPSIDNHIKEQLAYAPTMPVGIVLNHTLEMQLQKENNHVPWYIMRPGRIFALWGLLQETGTTAQTARIWKISAGCRSLIILPKISDALGYKRLKKEFGLSAAMPSGLLDQWDLLQELTQSPQFDSPWSAEVLFFTAPWHEKMRDGSWKELEYFLMKSAWKETSYLRDEGIFNFVFSMALAEKNLRPNPYLTDTVKHIYGIARGSVPGFTVAINDNSAPIQRLEQIFAEVYQHKFAPTFVHSGLYDSLNALNPVYYSLETPILADFSPKSRKAFNKMNDLREVKHIQTVIGKFIRENKQNLDNSPVYDIVDKVNYDYYHSDEDILNELNNTSELINFDMNMIQNMKKYKKPICTTSPFLRGCVRIAAKNEK